MVKGHFLSLQCIGNGWGFEGFVLVRVHRACHTVNTVRRVGDVWVPPTVTYLPYRVYGSTLSKPSGVLSCWPDTIRYDTRCYFNVRSKADISQLNLPHGTHSRILSAIQRAAQTVLGVYLKRTCSRVTSASSALGVFDDHALYRG